MSVAESAHPGDDGRRGTVLQFPHPPSVRLTKRRRKAPVDEHTDDASSHQRLADSVEALFLKCDRTLTDPETREVYLITLQMVSDMFGGARVNGIVTEEAGMELHAMIDGMKAAPELL